MEIPNIGKIEDRNATQIYVYMLRNTTNTHKIRSENYHIEIPQRNNMAAPTT